MLSDGTWTYTWEQGRQLKAMTDGTTNLSFSYDEEGKRVSKTVGNTTWKYVYNGSNLVYMTDGTNYLHFSYDATGVTGFLYNGDTYYYLKNAQGDVIGIANSTGTVVTEYSYDAWGTVVTEYSYDAWGNLVTTTDNEIGQLNPIRYRGYYYDTETGLYYLMSRYYDPEMGRFINADALITDFNNLLGCNQFAYCFNNPISLYDVAGLAPKAIIDKTAHDLVLKTLCDEYSQLSWTQTCIYYNGADFTGGWGFCDLYNKDTGEVWELKKQSDSKSCRTENARKQLNRYINGRLKHKLNMRLFLPSVTIISKGHIEEPVGGYIYYIDYWYEGDGILRYDYHREKTETHQEIEEISIAFTKGVIYFASYILFASGLSPKPLFA